MNVFRIVKVQDRAIIKLRRKEWMWIAVIVEAVWFSRQIVFIRAICIRIGKHTGVVMGIRMRSCKSLIVGNVWSAIVIGASRIVFLKFSLFGECCINGIDEIFEFMFLASLMLLVIEVCRL